MMGQSGGRSAGHRTGQGAVRRNTHREREYVEPPWEEQPPLPIYTSRGEKLLALAAYCTLVMIFVILALVGFGFIDG